MTESGTSSMSSYQRRQSKAEFWNEKSAKSAEQQIYFSTMTEFMGDYFGVETL